MIAFEVQYLTAMNACYTSINEPHCTLYFPEMHVPGFTSVTLVIIKHLERPHRPISVCSEGLVFNKGNTFHLIKHKLSKLPTNVTLLFPA